MIKRASKQIMKRIAAVLLIGSIGASLNVTAHEGHDHAPGTLKANYGGVVKAGKDINLEYVIEGAEVKLYPASHEGESLSPQDVKIQATGKIPKGKAEAIKLEIKDGAYVAKLDFKGAYRIEVVATADNKGKKSSFKFQVEK